MTAFTYPFAAILAQPALKLALLLAGVDWRLSVLLRGDKGSGKSTAARALAQILPEGAPFINLPLGATEERLLGGLNLSRAFEGQAELKHGLIHRAHGGVLYIDEVNLLPDSLADSLLDVASSGQHYLERDGFSVSAEAQFVLLGSMNIEEGALRPQLLDRFALSLDVEAPFEAAARAQIVGSRLLFDADPSAFCEAYREEQQKLREMVMQARALVGCLKPNAEILSYISAAVIDAGVRSLRADLALIRAANAHAALATRSETTRADVEAVLPLVLQRRKKQNESNTNPPPPPTNEGQNAETGSRQDRVFPPDARSVPPLPSPVRAPGAQGRNRSIQDSAVEQQLDIVKSLTRSFENTGKASLQPDHLAFQPRERQSSTRFVFVVDSSGSHGAQQRMRAVKGAVAALLRTSVSRQDEVAVITFRGSKAELVLEPCRDLEAAVRVLEFLPTGGRTPLAHALELACSVITPSALLVLITDGRANVPTKSLDAWTDALEAAQQIHCRCVLVDSSLDGSIQAAMPSLAAALHADVVKLDAFIEQPTNLFEFS